MFDYLLVVSLLICLLGVAYRWYRWYFGYPVLRQTPMAETVRPDGRLASLAAASMRIPQVLGDTLFQFNILKKNRRRWMMHMLVFWGFLGLLVMHAMAPVLSENWFSDYYATVNPYLFLRNLFGLMVMVGIAGAVFRRRSKSVVRKLTSVQDIVVLVILFSIILSGNLLEAVKITSETEFDEMTLDWAGLEGDDDTRSLRAYWAAEYGLVCRDDTLKHRADLMAEGREMHEEYCLSCHSKPQWAFVSYPVTRLISPLAPILDRYDWQAGLWGLHIAFCFAGLAYLPFSKMFHVISSPFHFWYNRSDDRSGDGDTARAKWKIALDACVNCAGCSDTCSVAPLYQVSRNKLLLPSERMKAIRNWAMRGTMDPDTLADLRKGHALCTECRRCSDICPNGIDTFQVSALFCKQIYTHKNRLSLEDLVQNRFQEATLRSHPRPPALIIGKPDQKSREFQDLKQRVSPCFTCKTCTNSCPVVGVSTNPGEELGLVPHQIMHAVGMGLSDMALHPPMIWQCTTCYTCQENCPQGVRITDIILHIRNQAFRQYDHPFSKEVLQ